MEINGYTLSRKWFDFCFENPEKINTNHTALYFYIIDKWNRFGQKEKFGLPTMFTMEALGIKSKNTYSKIFSDLVEFGFINIIQKSVNQNTSNVISINFAVSKNKSALDIALIQHGGRGEYSTVDSTVPIDKQVNKETKEQLKENIYRKFKHLSITVKDFEKLNETYTKEAIDDILDNIENYKKNKDYTNLYLTAKNWLKKNNIENKKLEEPKKKLLRNIDFSL